LCHLRSAFNRLQQRTVDARLPAGAGGFEVFDDFWREAQGDQLLGWSLLGAALATTDYFALVRYIGLLQPGGGCLLVVWVVGAVAGFEGDVVAVFVGEDAIPVGPTCGVVHGNWLASSWKLAVLETSLRG